MIRFHLGCTSIRKVQRKMANACMDCGADLDVPNDSLSGEIIGCPDCGLDYVIEEDESGSKQLTELLIEGEDWGE